MLDSHSPLPLYYQLKQILEKKIASGELRPGEQIPSENQLCEMYGISRTTVRQAINEMVNDAQLVRTQGRGTFVAEQQFIMSTSKITGFTQDMKELGLKPRTKMLEVSPLIPPPHVQLALGLDSNEVAVLVKRLRFNGDDVLGIDSAYFPFNRFSNLLKEDLASSSLYQLLSKKYETIPSRSSYNLEARKCPREFANMLELSLADPVLIIHEVFFDQNDLIFQYGEEIYRADRFSIRVEICHGEDELISGTPTKNNFHNKSK